MGVVIINLLSWLQCVTDPVYEDVNNAFERSLVFLHRVR